MSKPVLSFHVTYICSQKEPLPTLWLYMNIVLKGIGYVLILLNGGGSHVSTWINVLEICFFAYFSSPAPTSVSQHAYYDFMKE